MFNSIFILFSILAAINAQVPSWGPCPTMMPQKNLNMTALSGKWYEVQKLSGDLLEKCVIHTFDSKNSTYTIDRMYLNEVQPTIEGSTTADDLAEGGFSVVLSNAIIRIPLKYLILGTDYETYAVMYNCGELFGISNLQQYWVLSRQRTTTKKIDMKVNEILYKNKLNSTTFVKTVQTGCTN